MAKARFSEGLKCGRDTRVCRGFLAAAKHCNSYCNLSNSGIFRKRLCSAGADGRSGHHPQFINPKLQVRLHSSPPHCSLILPICLHLQKRKYLVPELHLRFHWTQRLHCGVNPNPLKSMGVLLLERIKPGT